VQVDARGSGCVAPIGVENEPQLLSRGTMPAGRSSVQSGINGSLALSCSAFAGRVQVGVPEHRRHERDGSPVVDGMRCAPSHWKWRLADGDGYGYKPFDQNSGRGNRPGVNVSWDDVKAFAAWLSKKTGRSDRLLSESESEYVNQEPRYRVGGSTINSKQASYIGGLIPTKSAKTT
jgi:hypothetical protein